MVDDQSNRINRFAEDSKQQVHKYDRFTKIRDSIGKVYRRNVSTRKKKPLWLGRQEDFIKECFHKNLIS